MSSVTASYRDAGLFERCRVVYLASHVEGGKLDKLRAMLGSLLQLWGLLLAGRVRLVHVHTASGVSFWRKSAQSSGLSSIRRMWQGGLAIGTPWVQAGSTTLPNQ